MNLLSTPKSFCAFCTPAHADWLNDLSFTPPVSVTSPTLSFWAAAVGAVVAAAAVVGATVAGPAGGRVAVGCAAGAVVGAVVAAGPHAPSASARATSIITNERFRMFFSSSENRLAETRRAFAHGSVASASPPLWTCVTDCAKIIDEHAEASKPLCYAA